MYSTTDNALAILKALFAANDKSGNIAGKIKYFSNVLPLLEGIIPLETFHPKIKVIIDFTAQFTLDYERKDKKTAEGTRLVEPDVLIDRALKLANFWFYYFTDAAFMNPMEKIISKNSTLSSNVSESRSATLDYFNDIQSKLEANNEEAANEFINKVINFFITDVQTNRSIGNIGTCSVTFRDNIQNFDSKMGQRSTLFFNAVTNIIHQLFSPMLPISVYAKGRLYTDTWFPIFTGYIFQALPSDNAGFTNFSIVCRDVLELARISSEMINPALINLKQIKAQSTVQFYTQPFYDKPTEKIAEMVFIGGSIGEGLGPRFVGPVEEGKETGITFQKLGDFSKLYSSNDPNSDFSNIYNEEGAYLKDDNSIGIGDFLFRLKNPHNVYIWGESVTPYKLFQFASPKHWTTQFSSRFDIIKLAAQFAYMDLYADVHGNVQIHPMRLANDFFYVSAKYKDANSKDGAPKKPFQSAYVISPHETLSSAPIFNIQEIKTYARIGGSPAEWGGPSEENSTKFGMIGTAVDEVYMKKYGFRLFQGFDGVFNYNPKISGSGGSYKFLDMVAREMLKHKNGELYTRTASIIFRPELDLANPIYFTDVSEIFYLQSISHTINVGGLATTTINGNFGRTEKESPPMLWDFIVGNQKLYVLSKFGDNVNVAESDLGVDLTKYLEAEKDRYTLPYAQMDSDAEKTAGQSKGITKRKKTKSKAPKEATVPGKQDQNYADAFTGGSSKLIPENKGN